jgi:hypothetical protein
MPRLHVCPVVEQSLHALPRLPQAVVLVFVMQVLPWQQPVRQLSRVQLPDVPPDEPDELPLAEPDGLPPEDPEPVAHDPLWQVSLATTQSTQSAPCSPQTESSVPSLQVPFTSQQPAQVAAQLPPSSEALASSPAVVASSPPELPLSSPLLGVPPPLPLPLLPPPLEESSPDDVGLLAAPASCGVEPPASGASPEAPEPPVAQAARIMGTTHANCSVLCSIEPMWTSRLSVYPSGALDHSPRRHQPRAAIFVRLEDR